LFEGCEIERQRITDEATIGTVLFCGSLLVRCISLGENASRHGKHWSFTMKSLLTALVLALTCATSAQVFADTKPTTKTAASKDIVDTILLEPRFSTLATAVKAAGLVETLKGKGPFTIFAPTNEAFAKIPKADLDALLADKNKLTEVLTYHVVPGKLLAADVTKKTSVKTAEGGDVKIAATKGSVMVGGAKVIATDMVASNGVIHVIDTVLMP